MGQPNWELEEIGNGLSGNQTKWLLDQLVIDKMGYQTMWDETKRALDKVRVDQVSIHPKFHTALLNTNYS